MSKASATTAVATTSPKNLTDISSLLDGMGGTGFENVTTRDLIIPRLTILQGLSPQVSQGKPEFDPNAKVGQIYDVGLQEAFPEGVQVIPVHYSKVLLEWAPRNTGKGLANIHTDLDIAGQARPDEKGRLMLPNGNYLQETAQFFVLNLTADGRKSFIPMASTQLKKARRLLTLATSERITDDMGNEIAPPLYFRAYNLTTVPESNAEGNWMGWKIERGPSLYEIDNASALVREIREFRASIIAGEARGDLAAVAEEESHTSRENAAM